MPKVQLKSGDKVQLAPTPFLLDLFNKKEFLRSDLRSEKATELGRKFGEVSGEVGEEATTFQFVEAGTTETTELPIEAIAELNETALPYGQQEEEVKEEEQQ